MRRFFLAATALTLLVSFGTAQDSKEATATREKLKKKISVEFNETGLKEIAAELKELTGISFMLDNPGGVSNNSKLTYSAKDKPVEEILDEMLKKPDLGYIVMSKGAYPGAVMIKKGKLRGYAEGDGPDKAMKKDDKPDPKAKDKTKPKETPKKDASKKEESKDEAKKDDPKKEEPKKEDKPKAEDDEERIESMAGRRLKTVKELIGDGKKEKARDILEDIIKKYPKTKAAEEAKKVLKELDD